MSSMVPSSSGSGRYQSRPLKRPSKDDKDKRRQGRNNVSSQMSRAGAAKRLETLTDGVADLTRQLGECRLRSQGWVNVIDVMFSTTLGTEVLVIPDPTVDVSADSIAIFGDWGEGGSTRAPIMLPSGAAYDWALAASSIIGDDGNPIIQGYRPPEVLEDVDDPSIQWDELRKRKDRNRAKSKRNEIKRLEDEMTDLQQQIQGYNLFEAWWGLTKETLVKSLRTWGASGINLSIAEDHYATLGAMPLPNSLLMSDSGYGGVIQTFDEFASGGRGGA